MSIVETPAYTAPEIPSKWDIIPIHSSDRANFKRCRRYWNWSSPARQNLTLRADVFGIIPALWFGTGIHWSLEQYYTPGLRRDPVEAWKTWFDIQWRGGEVTEEWLPRIYDLKPQLLSPVPDSPSDLDYDWPGSPGSPRIYLVRGLEDILPDPDHEKFEEMFELGIGMMDFYKEYAEEHDDFTVLMLEHDFSVPVWDYENKCILKRIDVREDSPNYGKELEVHARGRQDAIILRHGAERLGIMDHKTAISIGEDYFAKLETDEQCTNYLYAAQVEANYYDLPHKGKAFEEVLYNVLRKAYPKPPTVLNNGFFSIDREKESTTYPMLKSWIEKNLPGVGEAALNEKQLAYLEYLKDVGYEQFIIRRPVRRNQHQLHSAGERLYLESMDMLSDPLIYPNITDSFACLHCQFRPPCLAKEDGSDWEMLIRENYTSSKDR